MYFAFSVDFLEPTLDFQTPITFLLNNKKAQCVGIFFNWIVRNILVTNLSVFTEIYTVLTQEPVVLVLTERQTHYATSS